MLVDEAPIQSIKNCHSSLLVQLKLVLFIRKVQGYIGWIMYFLGGKKKITGYAGCKDVYVISFLVIFHRPQDCSWCPLDVEIQHKITVV